MVVNETLDNALDGSEDEAEGEEIMNQILDEIGIEITTKAAVVPSGRLGISDEAKIAEGSSQKTKSSLA